MNESMHSIAVILVASGLLFLGRTAYGKLAGFDADHQLTEADNPAVGTALFGFLVGILVVIAALLGTDAIDAGDANGQLWDLAELLAYGIIAIALLKVAGWCNDRFILHNFENKKELIDDKNVGAGAVLSGSYIASGLILAGSFSGRLDEDLSNALSSRFEVISQELMVALALFVLGQVVLAIYGRIYQWSQPHNVLDAIEQDYQLNGVTHGGNAAAGLAFGGNLAAVGLVLFGGARHDFEGWVPMLTDFGIAAGLALVLLPIWRIFVDKVMLSDADLGKEIYTDRNMNAALLETISVLGLATVLVFSI